MMSGVYEDNEEEVLEMILKRRVKVMDNMFAGDNVPDRVGDIRVFNELANSIEGQINAKTKIAKGLDKGDDDSKWGVLAAQLLRGIDPSSGKSVSTNLQLDRELQEEINVDIVKGHLEVNPKPLTLASIGVDEDK